MPTVVIAPSNVAAFPEGGGHFWVYLQYVLGLRQLGCEVQDTGPSSFLPNGEGMFRFSTPQEAAEAFEAINADYERHCRAARELAETCFDAKQVAGKILSHALNNVRVEVTA